MKIAVVNLSIIENPFMLAEIAMNTGIDSMVFDGPAAEDYTPVMREIIETISTPCKYVLRTTGERLTCDQMGFLSAHKILPRFIFNEAFAQFIPWRELSRFESIDFEIELTPYGLQIAPALEKLDGFCSNYGIPYNYTFFPVLSTGGLIDPSVIKRAEQIYIAQIGQILNDEMRALAFQTDVRARRKLWDALSVTPSALQIWSVKYGDMFYVLTDAAADCSGHSSQYAKSRSELGYNSPSSRSGQLH